MAECGPEIMVARLCVLLARWRLNPNSISVIVDGEKTSQFSEHRENIRDFRTICESLGFNVLVTERHSTENYISQAALDKVFVQHNYKALGAYEDFNKAQAKWSKTMNWRLFHEMAKHDFNQTDIYEFIEGKLSTLVRTP